jgi:hypothetical protein
MVSRWRNRVLQLHRSTGGEHSRREEGGDVTSPGGQDADRCGCPTGADSTAANGCPAARCRPAAAAQTELGQDTEWTKRWGQRRELMADTADLPAEPPATLAIAQMTPHHAIRTHSAIVGADQLLADL